jgi:predicted TIM-barrel fold metal-dependent hydrolase
MNTEYHLPDRIIDVHNHLDPACDPSEFIGSMDGAGIEITLIMGTPLRGNEHVLHAVRKHPDRLVGGVYADPRQIVKAIDTIKHYHAEGIRVVKLFPNFGYYPDDDAVRPFFDIVAELGMAVLSHCGWLWPKAGVTAAYYSHPGRFEKVVRTYPQTIFIMAHMGGIAGFLETAMLTTRTPNTYVDCSPGQGTWVMQHAGSMVAGIPPQKLLWGSDMQPLTNCIERDRKLLENIGFGPHLEEIFHSNARGILEKIEALPPS